MNRFLLILTLPALFALAACNDDFLDLSPEDKVSDGAVWKTPEHLKLYVNNFYNSEAFLPGYGDYGNMGIFTLDSKNGSDTQIGVNHNSRLNGENIVPADGGGWGVGDWEALRNVNYFFANYHKASGNQEEINSYVGEALFFRALFYFNKLRSFGDLPIYKDLLSIDNTGELHKGRDPRNKVVEWLMSDLDEAVMYLPSRSAGWNGRVNKETAMLLQARIALYEGTWEKHHKQENTPFKVEGEDGEKFIQKAADVTDKLIDLKTCELDNVGDTATGYWRLFNQESYAASKEVIFWRQYADNVFTHYWASYSSSGGGTGLTKSMVDSYLCTDGKPITMSPLYRGDSTLLRVVENRDPRLRQTIYVNDGQHFRFTMPNDTFMCPSFVGANENKCVTGYQLYKGHNPDRERAATQRGITALIYFRYAEALLINAEAKAELGTISQEDLNKTINLLRRRVGMPDLKISEVESWGNYDKEFPSLPNNIINEVRRERKVELAAEGFRTDDIFRWAAVNRLISGINNRPRGAMRAQWDNLPDSIVIRGIPVEPGTGYIDPYRGRL
ncbi:MAG: RagB/SusD family nutrient uptake outer membrane protein, partial [Prevotellaceae bacterium]|nr:RagB/SusD family nutrient uptake outer membrane protein [Prevotellaceae bacterium]